MAKDPHAELARVVGETFQQVADEALHVRTHFKVAAQRESEILTELKRAESQGTEARMLVGVAHSSGNTFLLPTEQAARTIVSLIVDGYGQFPTIVLLRSLLEDFG